MAREFSNNQYLIQIILPVNEQRGVDPSRVYVYEIIEINNPTRYDPKKGDLKHVRFVKSFPLSDRFGKNDLSLEQIAEKLHEIQEVGLERQNS